jgi:hypothetical protein
MGARGTVTANGRIDVERAIVDVQLQPGKLLPPQGPARGLMRHLNFWALPLDRPLTRHSISLDDSKESP